MRKFDSSDVKKYGIIAMILTTAQAVIGILTWRCGRNKGHKDCEQAMAEAKETINSYKKDN